MRRGLGICVALACFAAVGIASAAPRVVASVKPVHALVAGVMGELGKAELLVRGAASPHDFALRPSTARALARADVVFWVGPELETFLVKPLTALRVRAQVVALARAPGVTLLPLRRAGIWGPDTDGKTATPGPIPSDMTPTDTTPADGHIWLDPRNARAMVAAIAETLAAADPANAARYRANAARLAARIAALGVEISAGLRPVRAVPYIVFHDAYQYFEKRFGLNAQGAVTVHPDRPVGARRLRDIRAHIRGTDIRCLFREPQFAPRLATTVVEGTAAKIVVLDPLGAALPPGPDLYFTLMRGLAAGLRGCLIGAAP